MTPLPAAERAILLAGLEQGLPAFGLAPDPARNERLLDYIELLARWNRAYNLTAIDEPRQMLSRHLLDSLSIAPHLEGERLLDVGSGAGLPGVPLALWFPEREFHLLDSNGKKTRFLFQVRTELGLDNVRVHNLRAEQMRDARGFNCILARAVAPLAELLRLCAHLLAPGGALLAMKAELAHGELQAVGPPYNVAACIELAVPGIDRRRQLVRLVQEATPNNSDGPPP